MPLLLTGGAGFIGSHFTERLRRVSDEPIVCLDNFNDYYDPALKRANAALLERLPSGHGRRKVISAMPTRISRLLRRHSIDQVVHLGAYAGVRYSVENPADL